MFHIVRAHITRYGKLLSTYVRQHIQGIATILVAITLLAAVAGLIAVFLSLSAPKFTYEPVSACSRLTRQEAIDLLGSSTLQTSDEAPVISRDTAVSKCGYTDGNPDQTQMLVAAVIVRSAVNDEGVLANKRDFVASQPRGATEIVKGVGDAAFFNTSNGQLSVLHGRDWIILSFGVGADPASNTKDQALKFASVVVPNGATAVPRF